MTSLFRALGDPTRRRILELLRQRDLTVGEIARHFSVSLPSISYHLDLLRRADLVISEKRGQFVSYSLNTSVLDETLAWLAGLTANRSRSYESKSSGKKSGLELVPNRPARAALSRPRTTLG